MNEKERVDVSIVIPAYNEEKYIERCIDSLLRQTYEYFEIIIINDGSTDRTGEICRKYQQQDSRIKYHEKKNEGQGSARNYGVKFSKADYLIFIDADDWVDANYVQALYKEIYDSQCEVAVCDWLEHLLDGKTKQSSQKIRTDKLVLSVVEPTYHSKIWKKSLLIENHVEQPPIFFEDIATVPYLLLKAKKIAYVGSTLYHYWRNAGSTTLRFETLNDRYKSLQYLINLFSEDELNKYKEELSFFVKRRSQSDICVADSICEKTLMTMEDNYDEILGFLGMSVEKDVIKNEFVWGSYNLYRVSKFLNLVQVEWRFNASSIISAVTPVIEEVNNYCIERDILFRKTNMINDCSKRFAHMNPGEFSDVNFVLIDFLEERFPIGGENGAFITLSDVFYEKEESYKPKIILNIHERENMWFKACDQFIEKLQKNFKECCIVLVKMKLAEYYGKRNKEKQYDNIREIQDINNILEKYYQYFSNKFKNCIEVEVENEPYFYTDESFRYGCYPWHLNEEAYYCMGMKILNILGEKPITKLEYYRVDE